MIEPEKVWPSSFQNAFSYPMVNFVTGDASKADSDVAFPKSLSESTIWVKKSEYRLGVVAKIMFFAVKLSSAVSTSN